MRVASWAAIPCSMYPYRSPRSYRGNLHGSSTVDLNFSFEDRGDRLFGTITYATDLFDSGSIAEIIQHWQNLLAGACENPAKPVSQIPILSAVRKKSNRVRVESHRRRLPQ